MRLKANPPHNPQFLMSSSRKRLTWRKEAHARIHHRLNSSAATEAGNACEAHRQDPEASCWLASNTGMKAPPPDAYPTRVAADGLGLNPKDIERQSPHILE